MNISFQFVEVDWTGVGGRGVRETINLDLRLMDFKDFFFVLGWRRVAYKISNHFALRTRFIQRGYDFYFYWDSIFNMFPAGSVFCVFTVIGNILCHIFAGCVMSGATSLQEGRIIYLHLRVVFLSADILFHSWEMSRPPDSKESENRWCIHDQRQRMVNRSLVCLFAGGLHWILLISGSHVLCSATGWSLESKGSGYS